MSAPAGEGAAPDFRFDATQQALAESVAGFCRDRALRFSSRAPGDFAPLWRELAQLGVPALATQGSETGALEVAAVFEVLGAGGCPGPLVETLVATQLVPEALCAALAAGEKVASVVQPAGIPFAGHADVLVLLDDGAVDASGDPGGDGSGDATLCRVDGPVESFAMHGAEPWGRARIARVAGVEPLGSAARALALADICVASYLAGAGLGLVSSAAGYASKRRQFGRAIGDFQAVAHPLARLQLRFESARDLARAAAWHWDRPEGEGEGEAGRARSAAARIAASRWALDAAAVVHQVYGAVAYAEESEIPAAIRRMRVWALLRPGADSAQTALLAAHGLARANRASDAPGDTIRHE